MEHLDALKDMLDEVEAEYEVEEMDVDDYEEPGFLLRLSLGGDVLFRFDTEGTLIAVEDE